MKPNNTMKKPKTRTITDGMEILKRRYLRKNPALAKIVDEEFEKLKIGQQIYNMRMKARLTQTELAELAGTTHSVISRLESADYNGHSLKLLQRIAVSLGKTVNVRIVNRTDQTTGLLSRKNCNFSTQS